METSARPVNAKFSVKVWGIPVKEINGKIYLRVGLLADQERLLKAQRSGKSKLAEGVQLISCLGGKVKTGDTSLSRALKRSICESTGVAGIRETAFEPPIESMELWDKSLSFWMPVVLHGEPQPSEQYLDYPWISCEDFRDESRYVCLERWTWRWRKQTEAVRLVLLQASYFFMRRHHRGPDWSGYANLLGLL